MEHKRQEAITGDGDAEGGLQGGGGERGGRETWSQELTRSTSK